MHPHQTIRRLCLVGAAVLMACRPTFKPATFQSNERLFQASVREFQQRRWANAVAGFERLTTVLPARDFLMPPSLFYLGRAQQRRGDNLLAAQTFARLAESFPQDTLAAPALFQAGASYAAMWRRPDLDPTYGQTALSTFTEVQSRFPGTPQAAQAGNEISRLRDWFARRSLQSGEFYFRRKAYDSALIYFSDIVAQYPETPSARSARLLMARSYARINYRAELAETCATLRRTYPGGKEVADVCRGVPAPVGADSVQRAPVDSTAPAAPAPAPAPAPVP